MISTWILLYGFSSAIRAPLALVHAQIRFFLAGTETSRINEVPSIFDEMPVSSGTANDPTSTGHFWTTDSVPIVLSYTAVLVQAAVKAEKTPRFY